MAVNSQLVHIRTSNLSHLSLVALFCLILPYSASPCLVQVKTSSCTKYWWGYAPSCVRTDLPFWSCFTMISPCPTCTDTFRLLCHRVAHCFSVAFRFQSSFSGWVVLCVDRTHPLDFVTSRFVLSRRIVSGKALSLSFNNILCCSWIPGFAQTD